MKDCEACVQLAWDCRMLAAKEITRAAASAALASLASTPAAFSTSDSPCEAAGPASAVDSQALQQGIGSTAVLQAAAADAATASANAKAAVYQANAQRLYHCISQKLDRATAKVLQCAEEYADAKGEVVLTAQEGQLQLGLWVNTQKNPRFKLIDFSGLGVTVEIPKQIALANCAVRIQRHGHTHHSTTQTATSCLSPLGGTLQLNLLALPPPARHSKGWTIRQVTPLSSMVSILPYPIPPAGVDAASWQPDEEPPPFTVSMLLSQQLLLPAVLRVGWWNEQQQVWSEEGVSGVSFDRASGRLTFSTLHLGKLAILQDTAAALPYDSWMIRPTGGQGGASAAISLWVPMATMPCTQQHQQKQQEIVLEVGRGTVMLCGPALPQLKHVTGQPMPLWQLVNHCEGAGLRLAPGSCEAQVMGLKEKAAAVEAAMCADVACLCGTFLVASSRWNRVDEVGPDAALVRLSEVTDWEEGGRTQPHHAARIFHKETNVLVAQRQGVQGVMFVDGGNNKSAPPSLPDFSTIEGIQAAMKDPYCHLHADLQHLLAGPHAELSENPRAQALAASPEGLEQVKLVDPVFAETMLQVLQALRLFTFG